MSLLLFFYAFKLSNKLKHLKQQSHYKSTTTKHSASCRPQWCSTTTCLRLILTLCATPRAAGLVLSRFKCAASRMTLIRGTTYQAADGKRSVLVPSRCSLSIADSCHYCCLWSATTIFAAATTARPTMKEGGEEEGGLKHRWRVADNNAAINLGACSRPGSSHHHHPD